jgi:hypothetical protein
MARDSSNRVNRIISSSRGLQEELSINNNHPLNRHLATVIKKAYLEVFNKLQAMMAHGPKISKIQINHSQNHKALDRDRLTLNISNNNHLAKVRTLSFHKEPKEAAPQQ